MRQVLREIKLLLKHPIYILSMVVLPLFVTLFFTSLMQEGQPADMPIGVVDLDNTSATRKLTRMLDSFQASRVVAHYASMDEARHAMQKNEIYAFILFPKNMTRDMTSMRRPKMSFYYSNTSLTVGSLIFKDMKTVSTLASAAIGQATLQAKGMTAEQTRAFLQPIALDVHSVGNPAVNYNIFLSNMLAPAVLIVFIFLVTIYSIATEMKFGTYLEWIEASDGNFNIALYTKVLTQSVIWFIVYACMMGYMYGALSFPAPGGYWKLLLLGALTILASQGFAMFIFGLIASPRMAMSVGALLGVLSFSMVGSAFPIMAMDPPMHTLAWIFPLRHYYIIYQLCVFNTYPLSHVIPHIIALLGFMLLSLTVTHRMEREFKTFEYLP